MPTDLLKNKNLKDFLYESGIHGLRLLLYYTSFKYARLIWLLLIIVLIVWTHYTITTLSLAYIQKPTEVHIATDMLHISNTKFPSVAVCSANKLSRSKVLRFAEKLFQKQQTYKPHLVAGSVEEMAQHLLILKNFYGFAHDTEQLNTTVLSGLDEMFTLMFNNTSYPIRSYLARLAPDCSDLVVGGTIYGETINILDYFRKRMTSSSVCCMFNYNRRSYSKNKTRRYMEETYINKSKPIKFESSSLLNSVQFVLRSDPEEFTVTEFQTTAFQLYIFPPDDYAIIQSNHIGEILVDYGTIVEVPIQPEYFASSNRIRQFAPSVRKCYFHDEGQNILNQSYYSFDECLLLCRMDSMIKHCGCVAPTVAATTKDVTHCNFVDLPCLMKWKRFWFGWEDYQYVHEEDKDIKYDSTSGHRCPMCLPSCKGVDYFFEVNVKTLRSDYGPIYSYGILKDLDNSKPLSIVKLFFNQHYVLSTEMDIVGDWVVLLNQFGGIMSLVYGFSIVSYIEIVYFATGKFFILCFKNWKNKLEEKSTNLQKPLECDNNYSEEVEEEEPPPDYSLYWNELQPQHLVHMELYKLNLLKNLYKRHNT